MKRIRYLYEAIYRKYGEDGLDLIKDVSAAYGLEIAQRVRKDDAPWDIQQVGQYLVKVFNNMRSEGKVSEFTDQRVSIEVPRCPYPFQNVNICRAHTVMEEALVKGLNPNLKYVIEKSIPAGDQCCQHVLSYE
ncbi:hypothetical protein ACFLQV_04480 [Calditrichota bacterium]